jgi:hypothetical protein
MPEEGGRRKKMSPWIKHVMSVKKPGMSLGDAMKVAKKSWKGGGLQATGGGLQATGGTRKRKVRGGGGGNSGSGGAGFGSLYGFSGGPYTESSLADGAVRNDAYPAMQYEGANPAAMSGGRSRRRRRRGSRRA